MCVWNLLAASHCRVKLLLRDLAPILPGCHSCFFNAPQLHQEDSAPGAFALAGFFLSRSMGHSCTPLYSLRSSHKCYLLSEARPSLSIYLHLGHPDISTNPSLIHFPPKHFSPLNKPLNQFCPPTLPALQGKLWEGRHCLFCAECLAMVGAQGLMNE